jgi:co-chaperonin GroES (HSP10)
LDKLRISTNCGYVLKLGPLAYADKERYPTGPWCKEKDWVIFARYAGSRLPIEGGEVRLLNDDEVLGTIKNPEDVSASHIIIGGNYARRQEERSFSRCWRNRRC